MTATAAHDQFAGVFGELRGRSNDELTLRCDDSELLAVAGSLPMHNPFTGLSFYGPQRPGGPGPNLLCELAPLRCNRRGGTVSDKYGDLWVMHLSVIRSPASSRGAPRFYAFWLNHHGGSEDHRYTSGANIWVNTSLDAVLAAVADEVANRQRTFAGQWAGPGLRTLTRADVVAALIARARQQQR